MSKTYRERLEIPRKCECNIYVGCTCCGCPGVDGLSYVLARVDEVLEFLIKADDRARQLAFQSDNPSTVFIDAIGKATEALAALRAWRDGK